jgi:hypothetical protein
MAEPLGGLFLNRFEIIFNVGLAGGARANGASNLFALADSVSIKLVVQLPGRRLIRIPDQLVCSD